MKTLSILGRFIFAIPFLIFGISHLRNAAFIASQTISKWPYSEIWVYISGVALILTAVSIIINVKARFASGMLALLLLLIIILVHVVPPMMNHTEIYSMNLLKDISLMGAALMCTGTLNK